MRGLPAALTTFAQAILLLASVEASAQEDDVGRGGAVYANWCVACHQADGRGLDGLLAADFVADPARLDRPDAELLEVIREGRTGTAMPPWGKGLTEEQMADALAYIRATFSP